MEPLQDVENDLQPVLRSRIAPFVFSAKTLQAPPQNNETACISMSTPRRTALDPLAVINQQTTAGGELPTLSAISTAREKKTSTLAHCAAESNDRQPGAAGGTNPFQRGLVAEIAPVAIHRDD